MPLYYLPKGRTQKLTEVQQADIILHCKTPQADVEFATQYGVSRSCIRSYRLGRAGYALRQKLRTGWRP